jgi:hypothetical protein
MKEKLTSFELLSRGDWLSLVAIRINYKPNALKFDIFFSVL